MIVLMSSQLGETIGISVGVFVVVIAAALIIILSIIGYSRCIVFALFSVYNTIV